MKRLILLFSCTMCVSLLAAGPVLGRARPALTQGGAEASAATKAAGKWGGFAYYYSNPGCKGPYENVEGKTQWACYGRLEGGGNSGKYWQINVDPYGNISGEERLCSSKCPGSP
jgi:hypothetical protein